MSRIGARILVCLMTLLMLSAVAQAEKKVVVIAGLGGEERFQKQFISQAEQLYLVLTTDYGYRGEDIILHGSAGDSVDVSFLPADAQSIRSTFKKLSTSLSPTDELLVFLIGHGSFDGEWARFNIPGPDLRDVDFAGLLEPVRAGKIVLINACSASGPFVEKLSADGRIIITATRNGIERNATHFFSRLLATLGQPEEADLNKDGQLSVSELFINTRDRLVKYYSEQGLLRPEHPLLDDNGDGVGTETPDLLQGDGVQASRFFLQKQQQRQAGREAGKPQSLSAAQKAILARVEKLQSRKATMPEDQYYREFERLMLELARLNQQSEKK